MTAATSYRTDGQVEQKSLTLIRVKVEDAAKATDHPQGILISDYHPRGILVGDYHPRGILVGD